MQPLAHSLDINLSPGIRTTHSYGSLFLHFPWGSESAFRECRPGPEGSYKIQALRIAVPTTHYLRLLGPGHPRAALSRTPASSATCRMLHLLKVELHWAVFAVGGRGDSTLRQTHDPSILLGHAQFSRRGRSPHGPIFRHSGRLQYFLHFELDIQVRVAIVICIHPHKSFHFL